VIIQFIQPKQTNPSVDPNHEIGANLSVDPATAAVFGRSCNDCEIDRCREISQAKSGDHRARRVSVESNAREGRSSQDHRQKESHTSKNLVEKSQAIAERGLL